MDANAVIETEEQLGTGKLCEVCGARAGEVDADGARVEVTEWEGDLLCADCIDLLSHVRRWV